MGRPLFSTTHIDYCPCTTSHDTVCSLHSTDTTTPRPRVRILPTEAASEQFPARTLDPELAQTLGQSRDYLQRVSTVIEAAYQRLLNISTRLATPSERMSNEVQDGQAISQMGPNHSAIVLSSVAQETAAPNTQDTVGDAVAQRLSDPAVAETARRNMSTIRQRFAELTSALADDVNANPALTDGEPSRPSSTVLFGPRSREGMESRRPLLHNRRSNPSDATTTLGRRVEARASGSRDTLDTRVRETLVDSSFAVSLLNRHREQLLDTSRNFASTGRDGESQNIPSSSITTSHPPITTFRAPPWGYRERSAQWRENLEERRPTAGTSHSLRTTNDSSRPRGNVILPPTPPPPTQRLSVNRGGSSYSGLLDLPGLETETEAERYARLRRARELSRSLTTPITISDSSDDDDMYGWGRPTDPVWGQSITGTAGLNLSSSDGQRPFMGLATWGSYGENESERTAQLYDSASAGRRRTRGWARLDQDGNEITTDEEEEYERNRAQMRSRAQLLSSRFTNRDESMLDGARYSSADIPPPPPVVPRLSSMFMATTRDGAPSLPDDDGYVRINLGSSSLRATQSLPEGSESARQRWGRSRARRTAVSPIREVGTDTPFHASPIPWSSVDLTPTPRQKPRDRRLSARGRMSGRAPLAGR